MKTIKTWPELAADIFPEVVKSCPELKGITLEQFIEHMPFKMEFVLPDEPGDDDAMQRRKTFFNN